MASEWEELEKLSKEELIIELVKERTAHRQMDRALRGLIEVDYPADRKLPVFADDESDEGKTTGEWAYRIVRRAYEEYEDKDDFSPYDLDVYGLHEDDAIEAFKKLRMEGVITSDRNDQEGWFRWPVFSNANQITRPPRWRSRRTRSQLPRNSAEAAIITRSNRMLMGMLRLRLGASLTIVARTRIVRR